MGDDWVFTLVYPIFSLIMMIIIIIVLFLTVKTISRGVKGNNRFSANIPDNKILIGIIPRS